MLLAYLLLITSLTISAVAIYYSVAGLAAIFAAAFWPIVIMGTTLEVAKLVAASWLKQYWDKIPRLLKWYLTGAVVVLMLITSMGIFGFLSKAHLDQNLVGGDVTSKIAIFDEKIKTAKENIDANRKAIKQLDEAVDQVMGRSQDEKGADKAVALRRSQAKERARLFQEIEAEQKKISQLTEERAPIAAEVRKVEAEVGPIKYIAKLIYGDNPDQNILEKAVTWVIIMIIFVFDPLAVLMLLASQWTFAYLKEQQATQLPNPVDTGYVPGPWPFTVSDESIESKETDNATPKSLDTVETLDPDHVDYEFVGEPDKKLEIEKDTADLERPGDYLTTAYTPKIQTETQEQEATYDWDGGNSIYSRTYIEGLIEKLANKEIRIDNLNQEELNEINAVLNEQQRNNNNPA